MVPISWMPWNPKEGCKLGGRKRLNGGWAMLLGSLGSLGLVWAGWQWIRGQSMENLPLQTQSGAFAPHLDPGKESRGLDRVSGQTPLPRAGTGAAPDSQESIPPFLQEWAQLADTPLASPQDQAKAQKIALEQVPASLTLLMDPISAEPATASWAVQSRQREYALESVIHALRSPRAGEEEGFESSVEKFLEGCAKQADQITSDLKESGVYVLGYCSRLAQSLAKHHPPIYSKLLDQDDNRDRKFFKIVDKVIKNNRDKNKNPDPKGV